MQKVYHPKRGIVITGDRAIIDEILAEGGKLIDSVKDIKEPEKEPDSLDDLIGGDTVEKIPAPVMRPHRRGK